MTYFKYIATIFILSITSVQAETVLLDCNSKQKILVTDYWHTYYPKDMKNGEDRTFLVAINDNVVSIDGSEIKNINPKFRRENGYNSYGLLEKSEFLYDGTYRYENGQEDKYHELLRNKDYRFSHKRVQIFRVGGEFYYSDIFYIDDLKKSIYQKFNASNLDRGFVILNFDGACTPSKKKQLF